MFVYQWIFLSQPSRALTDCVIMEELRPTEFQADKIALFSGCYSYFCSRIYIIDRFALPFGKNKSLLLVWEYKYQQVGDADGNPLYS